MKRHFAIIVTILLLFGLSSLSFIGQRTSAAPEETINVTSPSMGEQYWVEDTLYIQWDKSKGGDYVKIDLYKGVTCYLTIVSNTLNTGGYGWTITADVSTSNDYRVKVTSVENSSVYGYSDDFMIHGRYITITSPSGGDTWYKGKTYYIYWDNYDAGSYFDIELYKSGLKYQTIASNVYNSWSWYVSESLPISSSYKIKIISRSYDSVYDDSGTFSIDEQSITVTSPEKNETWYRGETHTITWDSKNAGGYVEIGYAYGSSYSGYIIASNTSNDGEYSWTIPSGLASRTNYRIHIESLSDGTIADWGEYFSIDERLIVIISPKLGATWYKGDNYTIRWDAENIGSLVEISLRQEGWSVATINATTENDGEYTWMIPNNLSSSSSCQIKIKSVAHFKVYGISEYFTIGDRSITVHDPEEETWYIGEEHTITWDSEGAGSYVNIELYENGKYAFTIATNTENDGYYQWTIPSSLSTGSSYTIQITSIAYGDVSASSSGSIAIQETVLQQWSGAIILIIAVAIILVVGILVVKKFIWKSAPQPEKTDQEEIEKRTSVIPHEVTSEKLSDEEYEHIWENKRP